MRRGGCQRASDPWVSVGADGVGYAMGLALDWTRGAAGKPSNFYTIAVLVSRSADGGSTWSRPARLIRRADPTGASYNDEGSITADPARPGYAYATWSHSAGGGLLVDFSRTTDGGITWSRPRAIYDPTRQGQFTIGNKIAVEPDGTPLDLFYRG